MFSVPARLHFFKAACFFLLLLSFEKTVKQTRQNTILHPIFFFFFFPRGNDHHVIIERLPAFYMFRLRINFSICCENKSTYVMAAILKNSGRPVVLENVSGGHFEKKKKKKNASSCPVFHSRQDAKHVLFFYFALVGDFKYGVIGVRGWCWCWQPNLSSNFNPSPTCTICTMYMFTID